MWSVNRFWHEKHFSWKIIHKMRWRSVFRPFSKKLKFCILSIYSLMFYTVYFYCMPSWGLLKYIEIKLQRSRTSLPALFSTWFLKIIIFLVIFCKLTNFHCLVAFTSWDIGQGCDAINFEINLIFLIKPFFIHDEKVNIKI